MSFQAEAKRLQQEGIAGALALIGADGKVYWQTDNWTVDGASIINSWQKKEPAIHLQGVKYSTIDVTNSRMVCTNTNGQGHLILAKTPFWGGLVMAWCSPQNPVRLIYVDIAKLANTVKPG
ncbi:MAG: hypothetical protein GF308_08635 [Candidatus Heimdallarchaeota archaeon]|nr:hypothetical protein [Candidatus Heimdallarchaeota archaeon]